MVPPGTPNQQLNSATNTNVTGAFTPNAINYIGIDYTRFLDDATDAQSYFWDPSSNSETTSIVPQGDILTFTISISTTVWPSNILPIATVTTDAGNNVVTMTDCRWLLYRLGTGGSDPNPLYQYPWTAESEGRVENPSTAVANGPSPFEGGDKMLFSLKDWMNAVMTSIAQIQGTAYWYSPVSISGSLINLREDVALTVFTGNSTISNGVLPNTTPVLSTTGNINATNQLTNLASTTGIVPGQVILGSGIPAGTTVLSIASTTVTMSQNALTTATAVAVSFYAPGQITAPGQVNWASNPPGDGQLYLKLIGSRLDYKIVENPTGTTVTLSDNEVAYLNLTRNVSIAPNLIFTNGNAIVTSVGSVTWTTGLQAGDFVKKASDLDSGYYQILTVNSPSQVTLTTTYGGTSTSVTGAQSQYAYGVYTLPGQTGTLRDIQLADRSAVPLTGNIVWLFLRSDDGGSVARVYVKFLGAELQNGDAIEMSGPTLNNVLQYIGSPVESAVAPQYVASLYPGSVPEITQITTPAASAMSSNQYFFINSSANSRQYYVWVNKDGTGVDPAPFAAYTPIPWIISTGQTATQTATALVNALNGITPNDFLANNASAVVTVTNTSAGSANAASNFNVSGLTILVTQVGTGVGNYSMNDGDNLTLAIKKVDEEISDLFEALDSPSYDETITIVSSGGATPPYNPPVSINGPISSGTNITLPNNSRLSNAVQKYTVGKGTLQVFLNGQNLILGNDWTEVGSSGSASAQIQIQQNLVVGDELEFRISSGGGGGGGGGVGPQGPPGPPGANAAGGPVNISTKTGNYTVLSTDCFLRADCSSNSVTFSLPDATNVSIIGRIYYFKKIDNTANAMIVQGFGAQTIDGSNTLSTTTQYESFSIISNGTSWDIF
jgi:ribosomal protein L12E/L44/L45/RPP1/RPP2